MKNKFKKIFILTITLSVFVFCFTSFHKAYSSATDNVSGYAWGADNWVDSNMDAIDQSNEDIMNAPNDAGPGGMGWLSFNCTTDPGGCNSSNYGVNIDASGNITGYAWSSNYGWLQFGGLSGFPTGNGTTAANATLTGNAVTGWARFCSVAANPATCSGNTVSNSSNGGWDGWVSLSGTGYGVTTNIAGTILTGYAWGGSDVVGWINFTNVNYTKITNPTISLTANPASVTSGSNTTLNWSGVNIPINTVCVASGGDTTDSDGWSTQTFSPTIATSITGAFTTSALNTNGTYTYTIPCGGATSNVAVSVGSVGAPSLTLQPDSPAVYPPLYQTILRWTSTGTLHSCAATSLDSLFNGSVANPNLANSNMTVSPPNNPTEYDLTCLDASNNPVSATTDIARATPDETVLLTSNGVSSNTTTLSWTTTNVTPGSCNATSDTNWSGNKSDPTGSDSGVSVTAINPSVNTFTLTCSGQYDNAPISATVTLNTSSINTVSSKKTPHYIEK